MLENRQIENANWNQFYSISCFEYKDYALQNVYIGHEMMAKYTLQYFD